MKVKTSLIILLFFTTSYLSQAQWHSPADSLALLSIDAACDGSNTLNWNTDPNPDNWVGVFWSPFGNPKRVSILSINSKELTGILDVHTLEIFILNCADNNLTGLNISSMLSLGALECENNNLTSLNVSTTPNLTTLTCENNSLTSLNISALTILRIFNCSNNGLSSLDLSSQGNLDSLICNNNSLISLDLSPLTNLTGLSYNGNSLTELNISSLDNLNYLSCADNLLTELDLTNMMTLTDLRCNDNKLNSIDVSGLTNLIRFDCFNNNLPFSSLITGLNIDVFNYDPQNEIYSPIVANNDTILSYASDALIDGNVTSFRFYMEGEKIAENTFGMFTTDGIGDYHTQMTNPLFPFLVLTTAEITVNNLYPTLGVNVSELTIEATANSTATFEVISNRNWSVNSSENWLTPSHETGIYYETVTLTADENIEPSERTAQITLSTTLVDEISIVVTQKAATIVSSLGLTKRGIEIFPNPVLNELTLAYSSEELPLSIEVYSSGGDQLLLEKVISPVTRIDFSQYSSGLYFIRYTTPSFSVIQKIVKQ